LILSTIFSPEKSEKLILTVLGLFSVIIFYLLIEGRFILRFIPANTKGLILIGEVQSIKGPVYRKLKTDSLYLPLDKKKVVFLDDVITTGETSTLEIQLRIENQLTENILSLEPNTILRLGKLSDKLLINLQSGAIVTHFIEDKNIKIQMGADIRDIQIRKGSYFIKNASAGIQITAYTQNVTIKDDYNREIENRRSYKAPDNSETVTQEPSAENIDTKSTPLDLAVPLVLPYPAAGQAFLLTQEKTKQDFNPKVLTLVAKKTCDNSCHLTVVCNNNTIYENDFKAKTVPYYKLELQKHQNCHLFQWKFQDGLNNKDNFENSFSIEPFSENTFNNYLMDGRPIEIL